MKTIEVSDELYARLVKLSEEEDTIEEAGDEFIPYDWYGGNMDDAFWGGHDYGKIILAKSIIELGKDYGAVG